MPSRFPPRPARALCRCWRIGTQLRPKREFLELRVPHDQAAVIARLHQVGQVISRSYRGPAARFKVRIPPQHHDEFARTL